MNLKWEGVFAALWTPVNAQGEVLERDLKSNFDFLRQRGIHGVMALGSTGEFLYLDIRARRAALDIILAHSDGLPVLANISHIRTKTVLDLAKAARDSGAAAVAILPPYFYRLAQEDIEEFILQAGEKAGLPVWLYNFPERTGQALELETIARLAERLPVAGVKHSGADFSFHVPLVQLGREKRFTVFTGADVRLREAMGLGVKGCIGGLVNAAPEWIGQSYLAARNGSPEEADAGGASLQELERLIHGLEFPLNVGAAMEGRGLATGHPKAPRSERTASRYHEAVERTRHFFSRQAGSLKA